MILYQYPPQATISLSSGPVEFVLNGVGTQVNQDTATPANNKPLPSGLFISKNGVNLPVADSTTPSEVVAVPVKIMAVDGTNINITAGDINVQTTDIGASFDSMRVGDGSGNYIAVNASGKASVIATETNAAIGLLAKLSDTQPVSLASIPLATGAATSALQGTGNTSLGSIDTKLSSQATAALQGTGNTSLASLDTKTPSQGQAVMAASSPVVIASNQSAIPVTSTVTDVTASGNITTQNLVPAGAATAGSAVAISLNGHGAVAIQVTGTYTGALSAQATVDGTTWVTLNGILSANTGALASTITSAAQGIFQIEVAAFNQIRVTGLAAVTGTAVVSLRATRQQGLMSLDSPIPAGANIIGSLTANQSVNCAQMNGVAVTMGTGVSGTGVQRVTLATDINVPIASATTAGTITNAQIAVGISAVRCTVAGTAPSAVRKRLSIKPSINNTGRIFIGSSGVTTANGLEIVGPDRLDFEFDSGDYFMISDTAAQSVDVLEKV